MRHKIEYKEKADAEQLQRFLKTKNIDAETIVRNNKEVIIISTENKTVIENALDEYKFDEVELKNHIASLPEPVPVETQKEKYLKLTKVEDKLNFIAKQLGLKNAS